MAVEPLPLLSIRQCAELACLLEVTAPKPGNVHRGAGFEDVTFADFVTSAVAIGPAMEAACHQRLGTTVLTAIRATRACVNTNTNLGIVLLLAPLAKVPRDESLADGVQHVLRNLDQTDSRDVYSAIRLARAGSLGQVREMDLSHPAPPSLLEAMQSAACRDQIARQYVTGFVDVFESLLPWMSRGCEAGWSLVESIVHTHVRWLAREPDSLIVRKCGAEIAEHACRSAERVLTAGMPGDEDYHQALADFDFWLRADGHRRNPGTTADLIAATIFVGLRDGRLTCRRVVDP